MRVCFLIIAALFAGVGAFAQPTSVEGGPAITAVSPRPPTIIGGPEFGWSIDFSKVTHAQKWQMKWDENSLNTNAANFQKFNSVFAAPGVASWRVVGKKVAESTVGGPSFISIIEMYGATGVEDIKKLQYRAMSSGKEGPHGFELENEKCEPLPVGAQSCAIPLRFEPSKTFYAVFYSFNVGDRQFVITVHNAQPVPDRERPEEGMKILMSLIRVGSGD